MRAVGWLLFLAAAVAAGDPPDAARLLGPEGAAYAGELAARPDPDLGAWALALRAHAPGPPERTGARTWRVDLDVGGTEEATPIVTYVPPGLEAGKPAPALLYLHGAGGRGEEVLGLWRSAADALGMILIAPTDTIGEPGYGFTPRERAAALAALRWARRTFDLDEDRIHLTGVSRGGHASWDIGSRHPDLWASVSPMIGGPRWLPQRGQNNLRFLENIAHLPIRDLQGAKDQEGLLLNVRFAFRKLEDLGAPDAKLITFDDLGHSFRMEAVDWTKHLVRAKRDPVPPRVVLCSTGAARAAWIEVVTVKRDVAEAFTPRVDGRKWPGLDDMGQRAYMDELVAKRTARIEGRLTGKGRFEIRSRGVRKFRILLTPDMFDAGEPVVLSWNGRKRSLRATPSARVLLDEFRARFDRRFLPVAAVEVP